MERLREFHRKAPFLFFNGNTFATIGRELAFALFSDLVPGRKREVGSAVAHFIAGVLDRESMIAIVEGMCEAADFKPGDRVKTLRGSTRGVASGRQPVRVGCAPGEFATRLRHMKAPSPLSASRQPDEASRVRSAREFPWTKEKDGLLGKLTHRVLTEKLNRTLSGVRDRRIAESEESRAGA